MTEQQKSEIIRMRNKGMSFSQISDIIALSRNTVKSFCRRQNITVQSETSTENISDKFICKQCGKELHPMQGRKTPKFCSPYCRTKWWNSHPDKVNRKAIYKFICANCGKPFTAYGNKRRKFCSHECYINSRFKEVKCSEQQ